MTAFTNDLAGNSLNHLWALILKETREILRNPYLLFLIIVPPTIQLLILGGALDPQVRNLSLGVVDHSQSVQSRDLVKSLTGSGVFPKSVALKDEGVVSHQLEYGTLDVALVIPEDFSQNLASGNAAPVQVLVDGADAYSAGIASAYVLKTIYGFRPEEFNKAFKEKILEEVKERARFSAHQKQDLSSGVESEGAAASGSGMGQLFTGSQMNASALVSPDIQI
ncbi:MAG: ABC transporter permease, partial [Cyanobacteria bacterium SZAS LIN-3]|nr:ABC transporter permease [Cyanobacteria bacterium SZAS LIN-3]